VHQVKEEGREKAFVVDWEEGDLEVVAWVVVEVDLGVEELAHASVVFVVAVEGVVPALSAMVPVLVAVVA